MFINEYGDKNNPLFLLLAPMMVSGGIGMFWDNVLKLFVIFHAVSALAAWICTLF